MSDDKQMSRREFLGWLGKAGLVIGFGASGLLAACTSKSSGGSSGGKAKLVFARWGNGNDKEEWDKVLDGFRSENPEIEVELLYVPGDSWGGYFNKLSTMIAGGQPPDVAHIAIEGTQLFVAKDMALDLTPFMESDPVNDLDDIHPKIQEAFIVNKKYYALTFAWNNMVTYMNTKMLSEAGLPVPKPDWSGDDFLNYCKALTREKDGEKVFGFIVPSGWFLIEAWLFNNGSAILSDDMTKCTLNDPANIEMFQFFHDLIYKHKYSPSPSETGTMGDAFLQQHVAMHSAGRWPVKGYLDQNFRDFDIQYIPKFKTQQTIYGVDGFPILKASKHPNEAWKLIKYLNGVGPQKTLASTWSIPSRKAVADEVIPKVPPANGGIYYESANTARPVQAPPTFNKLDSIFNRYVSAIWANEMKVEQALNDATKEMQAALDEGI
ncbi:ABC transporter substrate-binding protein [Paenibacillus thermotolerans]|uniref:ABC transporter substrate-binding protein n=1 Tax=Paenibacillus thermotolerans TaxID=3027807 RepID=UPI00236807D2|nr:MULTISPECIES: sugar ABC transporter substrate-binding protein [unclassified Paenibacillus]